MSEERRVLNTGIVIAGAYADKVRRTLYAQLSNLVKSSKDFAKEVARASAELNMMLFHILVEGLGVEKGDAVRIRVEYTLNEATNRIEWFYDTLTIEVFKRVPDEKVGEVASRVIKEKLEKVREQFKEAPSPVPEVPGEAVKPPAPSTILDVVKSVDVIGETVGGGYLLKFVKADNSSIGVATLGSSEGGVVVDAIILGERGEAYRYVARIPGRLEQYVEEPSIIIDELRKLSHAIIGRREAEEMIKEKMELAL